jgi:hypothetical protein
VRSHACKPIPPFSAGFDSVADVDGSSDYPASNHSGVD